MLKKTDQAREVITEFTCKGFGSCALEDIVVVSAGLSMPPILELCSKEYTGAIPHNAIKYDAKAHTAYIRDNAPRPEPVPDPLLTEEEIQQQRRWNAAQFTEAKKAGFPKHTAMRDVFDADGIPIGRTNLWHKRVVDDWFDRLTGLAGR